MTNKKAAADMGIAMSVACLFSIIGKFLKQNIKVTGSVAVTVRT